MRHTTMTVAAATMLLAAPLAAQFDGPQIYWTLPINMNIVGVTAVHGAMNAAWTNFQRVEPSLQVDNSLYLLSYSRSLGLMGRSAVVTAMVPAGRIRVTSDLPPGTGVGNEFVHGLGDPSLGVWVNLRGAPKQKVRDFVRYEQGSTVALSSAVTFPLGRYHGDEPVNIGSNQWKVKLGLPIVQAIGSWVPGKRTTLEVTPTVTLAGDNTDALGLTLSQDPTYAAEAHLRRDITKKAFLSLDYSYIRLGATTYTDNASGDLSRTGSASQTHLFGVTAGFEVNDNMRLFITHMQTTSEDIDAVDLRGELLKVTVSWGWHSVLERLTALD